MKKTKVENVSGIKLDFFLKQDKKDIRVVLNPGESSWCDDGSSTKSMILYERKNLIKTSVEAEQNFFPPIDPEVVKNMKPVTVEQLKKAVEEMPKVKNVSDETVGGGLISVVPMGAPSGQLFYMEPVIGEQLTPLEKAKKETEEYKEESEKKYKGKKRGRKKKRGPKPGSKRKKDSGNSAEEKSE
jgi:hypothetical protein